jgi:hypothetical protein
VENRVCENHVLGRRKRFLSGVRVPERQGTRKWNIHVNTVDIKSGYLIRITRLVKREYEEACDDVYKAQDLGYL